jgi:putative membrane protein
MTIFHWITSAVAIMVAAFLIPGATVNLLGAAIFAVVLGLINTFIKPIIKIITLPINILTLGIFSLVLNTFIIMLGAAIVEGFDVSGFWSAFFFSILLSFINALFNLGHKKREQSS